MKKKAEIRNVKKEGLGNWRKAGNKKDRVEERGNTEVEERTRPSEGTKKKDEIGGHEIKEQMEKPREIGR